MVGGGRMGITHIAQFNLLEKFSIQWSIVEPNLMSRISLRIGLGGNKNYKVFKKVPKGEIFDFSVICSPTVFHQASYDLVRDISKKVFVEKPLALGPESIDKSKTFCGYVLLHHPLQKRMKSELLNVPIDRLQVGLSANTVLKKNTGWRGVLATGGGVVNEFGSHALSIIVDILGAVESIGIDAYEVVHSVDAPDRARIHGRSTSGVDFSVVLDWCDASSRKPSYRVEAYRSGVKICTHDLYEFSNEAETASIAEAPTNLPAYLRGIEFSNQALCFMNNADTRENIETAIEVDRILRGLKC